MKRMMVLTPIALSDGEVESVFPFYRLGKRVVGEGREWVKKCQRWRSGGVEVFGTVGSTKESGRPSKITPPTPTTVPAYPIELECREYR